ncbi:unnamed protein product [Arctia plantaginis]|uniref:Uncharacterized protein n=1 Tax=Arctia plantaginis TaxID=874455 RepID=A0A8S1BMV8_ARCPL|nr:unnamed protein product [Arctia plantaginis]
MAEAKTYNLKQLDGTGFSTWLFRIRSILREYECEEAVSSEAFASREPTALTKEEEIIVKEHVKALADSGIPVGLDDVSLVIQRALKSSWRSVLLDWRQTTRGKKAVALPKNCFAALLKRTLELSAQHSSSNIVAGFKAAGIYPLNRREALNRLAEYAKTPTNITNATEALAESFKAT